MPSSKQESCPLQVEVGRYKGLPEEHRVCALCDLGIVEDELDFVFYCPLYNDLRCVLFDKVQCQNPDWFWMTDGKMLSWLFEKDIFSLSRFLKKAWRQRLLHPELK